MSFRLLSVVCISYLLSAGLACTPPTERVECGMLFCNVSTHECQPCLTDSDCYESSLLCNAGKCESREFSRSVSFRTVFAVLGAILVCAIAVVAGVGGGGILVPLYIGLLDFPIVNAVALSQATIAGQSCLNLILICRRTHPDFPPPASRPVINYEYLSLMLPISLVGTLLGSIGSKVAADWMRVVMLYAILTNVLVRVIRKLRAQMSKDLKLADATQDTEDEGEEEDTREKEGLELDVQEGQKNPSLLSMEVEEDGSDDDEMFVDSLLPVSPQFPAKDILLVALCFSVLLIANLYRSHFAKCGDIEFVISIITPSFLLVGGYFVAKRRIRLLWDDVKRGIMPMEYFPFKYSRKTVIIFPLLAIFAGGAASMLGIGGGLVLSFLLFEAGLSPEEASATGSVATFFVALESGLQYLFQHQLPLDYGLVFFLAGCTSTLIGQFVFMKEIRRRGWKFLIVMSLSVIIGGSMVALTIFGVYNTVVILKHDGYLGFGNLCKASK